MDDTIELLIEYETAKEALALAKERELELRLKVVNKVFPTAQLGTHTEEFSEMVVKGEFKQNVKVDQDAFWDYKDQMSVEELEAANLKPSPLMSKIKKLDENNSTGLLESCLEFTPALPSIKILREE